MTTRRWWAVWLCWFALVILVALAGCTTVDAGAVADARIACEANPTLTGCAGPWRETR